MMARHVEILGSHEFQKHSTKRGQGKKSPQGIMQRNIRKSLKEIIEHNREKKPLKRTENNHGRTCTKKSPREKPTESSKRIMETFTETLTQYQKSKSTKRNYRKNSPRVGTQSNH
jgi:hypothetical protein